MCTRSVLSLRFYSGLCSKGVLKLLNNLNIHKASGPDGLSARVLKECSSEISPLLDKRIYSQVDQLVAL